MGTRAEIFISSKKQGFTKVFYKHNDGYIKGTLPVLSKIIEKDYDSKMVNTLMVALMEVTPNAINYDGKYAPNLHKSKKYVGSGDLEYVYVLNLDAKLLKVYHGYGNSLELSSLEIYNVLCDAQRYREGQQRDAFKGLLWLSTEFSYNGGIILSLGGVDVPKSLNQKMHIA